MKVTIIRFAGLLVLALLITVYVDSGISGDCECKGCKYKDAPSSYESCGTTSPHLKCERGYYEKKDKEDYNFDEFHYTDGTKKYKEYDCTTAIANGKGCSEEPPEGYGACDVIHDDCEYTADSGDDVPTGCDDKPC